MVDPLVTVIVVPRERFSAAPASLESILADRSTPFHLIYVDAGSPPPAAAFLAERARSAGFSLIRVDRYLPPNKARNLGFAHVKTPYVVFIDNDVVVDEGWLAPLLRCAEETRAGVVGPLTLIGPRADGVIHMAGGLCRIKQEGDRRVFREGHRFMNRRLDEVRAALARAPTELVELHCCLVDAALLRTLGGLDEGFLCSREHIDLCLSARAAGREVWFEPASVITYLPPPPFAPGDVRFFLTRWSEAWARPTLAHFHEKWRIDDDGDVESVVWLKKRRYHVLEPWFSRGVSLASAVVGKERLKRFARRFVFPVEGLINRAVVRPPAEPP